MRAGLSDKVTGVRARALLLALAMIDQVNYIQVTDLEGCMYGILRAVEVRIC